MGRTSIAAKQAGFEPQVRPTFSRQSLSELEDEDDSRRVTVVNCLSCPAVGAGVALELEVTAMMGISNARSAFPEISST